jgi:ankyrin repeat protein
MKGTPVRKYSKDYALSVAWVGATPFWLASRFGEVAIMRALVAAGADPTLASDDGMPPLYAAIVAKQGLGDRRERYLSPVEIAALDPAEDERQTVETVSAAIDLGADLNAATASGDTPLHGAVSKKYGSVVELLGRKGATLTMRNKAGKTPLAVAADETTAWDERLQSIAAALRTLGAQE